jgi:predicted transcriptional regulator
MNWYSRDDLIDALRQLAERLGRTPTGPEAIADPHTPSHSTYARRFGSWRKAVEAAGLPLDPRKMGYDRETLLAHLQALAEALGRTPTVNDLKALDGPCDKTYRNQFGKWSAALAEAGLEVGPRGRRYERDELLEILRSFAEDLGHAPSERELKKRDDLPNPGTYRDHFGGWNAALREAGLTPRYPTSRSEDGDER